MIELAPEARERIERALGQDLLSVARLAGGACQDNFVIEAGLPGQVDAPRSRWVLRSDARTSLPGSIDRAREFEVLQAAVRAGVTTAAPRDLLPDLLAPGASAYLLEWVPGEAIGRKIVRGEELSEARKKLPELLVGELAKIHAITPASEPSLLDAEASGKPGFSPALARVASMRVSVAKLHSPRPALALLLRWLEENAPPPDGDICLVHGDFRTGNFMVTREGLSAVLDWEFAHWGSPYEDLTWISVRDWRFGQLALPIGGIARRAPFYEAYTRATGRELSPALLHYWEVLGNVSWAVGAACQSERYTHGGEDDLELLAIGRRAAEMEWEALRLVMKGAI